MNFYERRILPYVLHAAMRQSRFTPYRRRVVSAAEGRVLEIGAGSGLNLPYYSATVTALIGLDPSPALLSRARAPQRTMMAPGRPSGRPTTWLEASAEAIPLEDASLDTVVTTWTLCSIPDISAALRDVRRVLKPSGRLLFIEHGRAREASVRVWQDRLTPLWTRVAGGCHLNRPIDRLIEDAGFRIEQLKTDYMDGPRPMTFMYEGSARPM